MESVEYFSRMMTRLSKLQSSRKFCDVKFICADGNVEAHSVILASSCTALNHLITVAGLTIPVESYTTETVQCLLTYIYTGHIDCDSSERLLSFASLASQLFQVNLYLPLFDECCHNRDQFSVVKRVVQLKLAAFNLESDVPGQDGLKEYAKHDEHDTNNTESISIDCLSPSAVLPQTTSQIVSTTCKDNATRTDYTCDVKNEPCGTVNLESVNEESDKGPVRVDSSSTGESQTLSKETKTRSKHTVNSRRVYKEIEKCEARISKDLITRSKTKTRPGKLTKNIKRKQKQLKKKKKVTKVSKEVPETEDDLMHEDGEHVPDWTVHKGGDWKPDKYKNMQQKTNKRTLPYLCMMCGHRAHDMRHHLNHLHCKHKIPYKAEDIGKWVDVCPYEGCNYTAALNMKSHIFHIHETEAGTFTCDPCKKNFKRESGLRTHLRRHHVTPGELKPCPECGKMVTSHYIEKHIATVHNPDNYYLCSHCHFKTKALASARFHMITKHNDYSLGKVTIHKCKYCEYQGTHVDNIKRHVKAVHEIKMGLQIKDVLCDICGKAFAHQRTMASHRLWHTNKDRYKCEFCSFSAPFSRHVKVHTQRQHTQKELRPWRCSHCAYASNDRGNLKKHLLNTHKLPEPDVVEIMKASLTSAQSQQNQQSYVTSENF